MFNLASGQQGRKSLLSSYTGVLGSSILRHRTDMAERARRVEAERANKVKSQFIANMSHELRTPLNAIIGFSKILKEIDEQPLTAEQIKDYSNVIHETAGQLLSIINEILDISKILSGKHTIEYQDVLISEILQSCLNVVKIPAKALKLEILTKIDPDLPLIFADPVKLKQIFTNILSNAVKFTPQNGSVVISAEMSDPATLSVTIADTGVGMTQDEIVVAVTAFGQAESDLNRKHEGTGLGLPIAKALVDMHDGELFLSSVKGIGTEVRIDLPVKLNSSSNKSDESGAEPAIAESKQKSTQAKEQ